MRISVIMATYNRAHLLARSLHCYEKQTHQDFELIVMDDDSKDGTDELCYNFQGKLDLKYIRVRKPPGVHWRDGASLINFALRAAEGDLIIQTHPEVMPGFDSLRALGANVESTPEGLRDSYYYSCKPYYLSPDEQAMISLAYWQEKGPQAVRELRGFYGKAKSAEFRGNKDFTAEGVEAAKTWESFVFGGMTRKGWRAVGGIPSSSQWGTVDVTFFNLRNQMGIKTCTPSDLPTFCVHQNHDDPAKDTLTPRDMEKCMAEAGKIEKQDNIRW